MGFRQSGEKKGKMLSTTKDYTYLVRTLCPYFFALRMLSSWDNVSPNRDYETLYTCKMYDFRFLSIQRPTDHVLFFANYKAISHLLHVHNMLRLPCLTEAPTTTSISGDVSLPGKLPQS